MNDKMNIEVPTPITRETLDEAIQAGCQSPGCDCAGEELFFRSNCHPEENKVYLGYINGVLQAQCVVCEQPVVNVKVASNALSTPSEN